MVGVLGELVGGGLQLPTEELGGAPAVEDVGHRDKESAECVVERVGEGGGEGVLVGVEKDGEVGKDGEEISNKDTIVL